MNDMDVSTQMPEDEKPLDPITRMIRLITQPSVAFSGLAMDKISWLLPFFLVGIAAVSGPLLMPELYAEQQQEFIDSYVEQGILTEEQAFDMRQRTEEGNESTSAGSIVTALMMGLAGQFLMRLLLPAAILLVGIRFIMEGQIRYWAMVSLLAFTAVPAFIREVIRIPLQMSKNSLDVYFSPAVMTGTESTAGFAMNMLDLFDLWILYLLITGLATVSGISQGRAAGLVIPLWAILCLCMIGVKMSRFGGGF